ASVCRARALGGRPWAALRRLALGAVADCSPALAEDVVAMGRQELHLLYSCLCKRPRPERRHGLTDVEVEMVLTAGMPLMSQARFTSPLKRALVRRLAERHADLALKVERLSMTQFAKLCGEVRGLARDEAGGRGRLSAAGLLARLFLGELVSAGRDARPHGRAAQGGNHARQGVQPRARESERRRPRVAAWL